MNFPFELKLLKTFTFEIVLALLLTFHFELTLLIICIWLMSSPFKLHLRLLMTFPSA